MSACVTHISWDNLVVLCPLIVQRGLDMQDVSKSPHPSQSLHTTHKYAHTVHADIQLILGV